MFASLITGLASLAASIRQALPSAANWLRARRADHRFLYDSYRRRVDELEADRHEDRHRIRVLEESDEECRRARFDCEQRERVMAAKVGNLEDRVRLLEAGQ